MARRAPAPELMLGRLRCWPTEDGSALGGGAAAPPPVRSSRGSQPVRAGPGGLNTSQLPHYSLAPSNRNQPHASVMAERRSKAAADASVDVSAAPHAMMGSYAGVADRSAQTTCLVASVTFFRTATGELSERFLDRGDQTPAPPMASVCFGNTLAGRKSARRL